MKRLLSVLLLLLFLLPVPAHAQQESDQITVRVAVSENPPKIFTNDEGDIVGFWPDVIDSIADLEGWNIEYVHGTWDEGLDRLRKGEVDMLSDIAYSPGRAEEFEFSDETGFINWATLYTTESTPVKSLADLEGQRIAVLDGDIHFTGPLGIKSLMESFDYDAEYLRLPSYEENLKAIERGDADVAVVNWLFGVNIEDEYAVTRTNIVFNPVELRFAFPSDGELTDTIKPAIDSHLREFKNDSKSVYYSSIIRDLRLNIQRIEVQPAWVRPVVILLLALIGVALLFGLASRLYSNRLKQKVSEQKEELTKSETKYQDLTDLLPQSVFEANTKGIITYVNDFAESLFGYKKKTLLDEFLLTDLFADESGKSIAKQMPKNGDPEVTEATGLKSDGTTFPVVIQTAAIHDGDSVVGIRGVIADMTRQKSAESELAQKLEELEKITNTMVGRELKMKELKEQLSEGDKQEPQEE